MDIPKGYVIYFLGAAILSAAIIASGDMPLGVGTFGGLTLAFGGAASIMYASDYE